MRAGGAGIAAFFTPTAAGTELALGKETRIFDGEPHVLERGIRTDFAFLRGWRADTLGIVQFRGRSRNVNVSFAKAARVAIAEVDEIVSAGAIPPDEVHLPGVFVEMVVKSMVQMDVKNLPMRRGRSGATARTYWGKVALTRAEIAHRATLLRTSRVSPPLR